MKFNFFFIFLIVTLATRCQTLSQNEKDSIQIAFEEEREKSNRELIGNPFPVFQFGGKTGTIDNNNLKGKIVFINFWFAACPPCVAEFEALNEMYNELKSIKNFEFISFTFDTDEQIEKTRAKYNIQYKVFSIPRTECYRLNNNNGFPTSMILDSLGVVKYRTSGGHLEKEKVQQFIRNTIFPKIVNLLELDAAAGLWIRKIRI